MTKEIMAECMGESRKLFNQDYDVEISMYHPAVATIAAALYKERMAVWGRSFLGHTHIMGPGTTSVEACTCSDKEPGPDACYCKPWDCTCEPGEHGVCD